MNLYSLTNLNNASTVDLLRNSITADMFDKEELLPNYLYEYKDNPANLFNNLAAGRYTYGRYYVLTDDTNKFVASAGWHPYNNNTALALTRMLVAPNYRATYVVGKEILPSIIKETKQFERVWITCNEYNRAIYDWFSTGKSMGGNWPSIYKNFKPIGQHLVNHTLQYVAEHTNK
jgi:hypothetical protein